mmetsp:Transcript_39341/g.44786  ORF Transcript_39341/g.44786 Transcript_39341/m.44786 type:complete len:174 (+) Transcript_39341:62-583(+)|eukprot:CAMPEP_0115020736 /NCGR_PEP_ID=MMETSP0216-20121206/30378_1 /TAXON_ID=223996 /ORGANISM="Protocruzia adherens, Strain Boccale" /LENGTH=173 /DNA_ID=CAMNT_0002392777 /DNA_START=45 /DNA_END=566 /DNA_ORIENTATION=+
MVLIPKENRRKLYENLVSEGVIVVKKDSTLLKHQEVDIPNLHAMMMLKSLKSKGLVEEDFNWLWSYYKLNNEGLTKLRDYLGFPPEVIPKTMKKQPKKTKSRMLPEEASERPSRYREDGGYRAEGEAGEKTEGGEESGSGYRGTRGRGGIRGTRGSRGGRGGFRGGRGRGSDE